MKLSEISFDYNNLRLFAGMQGAGKTCAAVSLASPAKRMFVYDFDGRIAGAMGLRSKIQEGIDNTDYEFFSLLNQNDMTSFEQKLTSQLKAAEKGNLPYSYILIESIDTLVDSYLQLAAVYAKTGTSGLGNLKIGGVNMNDPSHYRFAYACWTNLIANLRQFPQTVQVIFTANTIDETETEKVTDQKTGKEIDKPYGKQNVIGQKLNLPLSLAAKIPGTFDEVYFFDRSLNPTLPSTPLTYTCEFRGRLAKTAREYLPNRINITGKSFAATFNALGKDTTNV